MAVTEKNELFFYKDDITSMQTPVRIFGYIHASYSEWLEPDALECRGIMFEMKDGKPVRVMSRPMEKFFNLSENPFTERLNLEENIFIMDKLDGSLISSYIDCGHVHLKTKGALFSDQAIAANTLLNSMEYWELRDTIKEYSEYTFNMEYTAPDNRIVVPYQKPELTILNVRHNITGEYVPHSQLNAIPLIRRYLVKGSFSGAGKFPGIRATMQNEEGYEGYVCEMPDGQKFKIKTEWYVNLHHKRDNALVDSELLKYTLNEETDDLKALFATDEYALSRITEYENFYREMLRFCFHTADMFYGANAGADRKTYAARAQAYANGLDRKQKYIFDVLMLTHDGIDYDRILRFVKIHLERNYRSLMPESMLITSKPR